MLCPHPAYQSNSRAAPIRVLFNLQGQWLTYAYTNGNPGATRNQLRYWAFAFEVGPQFQRLPKIQREASEKVLRFE